MQLSPGVLRSLPRVLVVAAHALVLLIALAGPFYAIAEAIRALFDPAGTEHISEIVDARRWLTLLGNTLVVCGTAVLTAGLVGGLLALLATRTDLPGRRALLGLALLAACIPVYVSAVVFFAWVPAYVLLYSAVACGLLYGVVFTPLATLVLAAAFRAADRELEDQALLDARPSTVLRRVTIRHAAWGFATVGMVVLLLVATDFTLADILQVRTFAEETYSQYALDNRSAGPLLTSVPVGGVLAALLIAAQARYRHTGETSLWHFGAPARVYALGRWRWPLASAINAVVLFLLIGALVLLLSRISPLDGLGRVALGVQRELWTSVVLALAGATLITAVAGGLAWSVARGRWSRPLVIAAIILLLAVPSPVVGIGLIGLLNRPGVLGWIYDSPLVFILVYLTRFLPFATLLLVPAVRRIPREVELAARMDGCDWAGEHRHVRAPALLGNAAVVWIVMVILCFAEIGATKLVAPPGWETAAVRAFTLIHFGVYRDLAVLALLAAGIVVVLWACLLFVIHRSGRACSPGASVRARRGTSP